MNQSYIAINLFIETKDGEHEADFLLIAKNHNHFKGLLEQAIEQLKENDWHIDIIPENVNLYARLISQNLNTEGIHSHIRENYLNENYIYSYVKNSVNPCVNAVLYDDFIAQVTKRSIMEADIQDVITTLIDDH